jgi:hypothetical protein
LNVIDFGKNIFQSELAFKLDCISPDFVLMTAKHFAQRKDSVWYVGKDETSQQSLITAGDGGKDHPFYQIKLSEDKLGLWVGWHVTYDAWRHWRDDVIGELISLSADVPSSFVSFMASQASITVPEASMKKMADVPELRSLLAFAARYIPPEFMSKGAGHSIFANESRTKIIETQMVGNPATNESTFTYLNRWLIADPRKNVQQNLSEHFAAFDELFQRFHDSYVALLF